MTWATEALFVAGGDFVTEHWQAFQHQAGVSAVILLALTPPTFSMDPLPAALLWLPVDDEGHYTLEQLKLGTQFIADMLASQRKVLLHSPTALHHTRPLVAAHLLAQGKSLARVRREMEQRPWLPPYKGDVALLEKFLDELQSKQVDPQIRRKQVDK
jgi:hypothetical protein